MKLLHLILRGYYQLNRLAGLANIRYNFNTQTLDFHHVPSITYSIVLNCCFFVILAYVYVQELQCAVATVYSMLNLVVDVTHAASFFISFIVLWMKRKQLQSLARTFRYVYCKYEHMLTTRQHLRRKLRNELLKYICAALPKLVVAYVYCFHNNNCTFAKDLVRLLTGLSQCGFALMQLLLDLNFYCLFLFAEIFYDMLQENIQSTCEDVMMLVQSFGYRGTVWRRHLAEQVHDFASDKKRVDVYLELFVHVFASRLLLAIVCYYLTMTSGIFYLYVKTAQYEQTDKLVLLQVLLDSGGNFLRNLFFFGICERIDEIAASIRIHLVQILVNAPKCLKQENDGQLVRRVEFLILRLKMDEECSLNIFGFMDINYRTYFEIQMSLLSSVVILYQSFFYNV